MTISPLSGTGALKPRTNVVRQARTNLPSKGAPGIVPKPFLTVNLVKATKRCARIYTLSGGNKCTQYISRDAYSPNPRFGTALIELVVYLPESYCVPVQVYHGMLCLIQIDFKVIFVYAMTVDKPYVVQMMGLQSMLETV